MGDSIKRAHEHLGVFFPTVRKRVIDTNCEIPQGLSVFNVNSHRDFDSRYQGYIHTDNFEDITSPMKESFDHSSCVI